uniref:Uncharacterized protein n=1 Tax=Arundo donax TaxID=35708 RepID=A0A0A8YG83_ARUDO
MMGSRHHHHLDAHSHCPRGRRRHAGSRPDPPPPR